MMNFAENHRTQSEYDNSRVGKNFLFQFVNNYFVLFYIAYLREVKDPISKAAHPCLNGNCLPELQIQLIVVFSGKTIGKQLAYTMKPFIFKWKAQCKANSMTKKIVKASAKGTSLMPAAMQQGNNDEFCFKNAEFCIENDGFYIKNDEMCIESHGPGRIPRW